MSDQCRMKHAVGFLLLEMWLREEARLYSTRIIIITSRPETMWHLPVPYFISQETACNDTYKLLEQVIFGPRVLNQVKSECFDPLCR